ncbi:MAG: GAF domain-containing protein, partial [Chroococcidiopsidaceae cyanobacterium CP_BM_ER_R8_30]|nr:GAF domain-containing protein [Chroococcidiopsidaceae cyanobacterium CP_BM_ER_R8_30]
MAEREHRSPGNDRDRYIGKLWSSSSIAQELLLLLAELAGELSTARHFDVLQQILSRKLRWLIDFDQCTLAVRFDSLDKEYVLFEVTSPSRAKSIPPQTIPLEEGWSGRVLTDSKPYFIQDLAQLIPSMAAPPNAGWGIAPDARSLMVLPLQSGECTIGSLNFSSSRIGVYSITWRNLASLLGAQIGGQLGSVLSQVQLKGSLLVAPARQIKAKRFPLLPEVASGRTLGSMRSTPTSFSTQERKLKNAYEFRALEHQVQERTRQLQQALDFEARLKRITDKVRDSLDESQIVQAAVKELALGLSVGCCNIALYNLEQGTSTICYEYAISIPASQGRIAQMANYPELYRQLLQNQYFQFCSIVPHPYRGRVAMFASPISDDQGVIGDLWLINQKDHVFSESEIRLVQQVTNQCAIAIRQARLYQAATAQVAELEKLNRLKDDFLSTVSHEL